MKIELSHDILAKTIYDRSSAEDKTRLKVHSFIRVRHQFFSENKKSLLSKEDLNYIQPYVEKLDLNKEQNDFVNKSKARARAKTVMTWAITFVVMVALVAVSVWAVNSRNAAVSNKLLAQKKEKEVERQRDSLRLANERFIQAELMRKKLQEDLEVGNAALNANKEQLAAALIDLQLKSEQLKIAYAVIEKQNRELSDANRQLNDANRQLAANNKTLEREKKSLDIEYANKKTEVTQMESKVLSSRAVYALRKDEDLKTAFQLARKAYELDPNNKEACDVLYAIDSGRGGDYFNNKVPKRSLDVIIKDKTFIYGTISPTLEREAIKGMMKSR